MSQARPFKLFGWEYKYQQMLKIFLIRTDKINASTSVYWLYVDMRIAHIRDRGYTTLLKTQLILSDAQDQPISSVESELITSL